MNSIRLYLTLQLVLSLFHNEVANGARILGLFPIVSKSHFSIIRRIMTSLASRGHEVIVLSGFEETEIIENYTNIYLRDGLFSGVDNYDIQERAYLDVTDFLKNAGQFETDSCSTILSDDDDRIKKAILSKTYDLLFAEMYQVTCFLSLAAYLNVPIIWLVAPTAHPPIDYFTGNPNNPAYITATMSGSPKTMNFRQRLMNTYEIAMYHLSQLIVFDSKSVDIFNKFYNADITVNQIHQLPNLAFTYGHYSLISRPNVPNVIEIGGAHIQEEKPLSGEVKDFIDNAEHGVIFMSFGSTIKANTISKDKLAIFTEVFSKIPQKVIWRWNIANLTEVSDNVMTGYWFPQTDILAHPNVRAFISHGGILGSYEAIYTATPIIGIPFFFDQITNIRILEENGVATYLDYWKLTANDLRESIDKVFNNSRYTENMQKLSLSFKDRPMSALDTAVYWTEYIIRHKGAPHLRSPAAGMPLYQYLLLDVILFLLICLFLVLFLTKTIVFKILSFTTYLSTKVKTKIF